ncbi:MAG: Asp-tRNA(Asn)/Glu-tRNA(Gln) amidotransferase GatCAB subunit B, partial [Planctomycetales bacterium]|nr:Asp-tRNA(Asn)/Glu-tRNA(Gln) amidotransferase GatCAB subunit B [Planctomycetales bacterium]
SLHDEAAGQADSRIDLNRCGTPLLEIVSQPDMRSALEARTYLTELKLLLEYLGVSDCNMQEGSLRVDANINLHIDSSEGEVATPIVEIKNMNSFRAVERALEYEAARQYDVWQETGEKKGDVPKQTRGWDDTAGVTRGQRHKEESSDYRYFPDPDLAPVTVTEEEIEAVRAELGESPAQIRERLGVEFDISAYDADVLVNQGPLLVAYYLELAGASGDAKAASNWIQQDVLRWLNEREASIESYPVKAAELAKLIKRVAEGEFNTSRGREVLAVMVDARKSVEDAIAELGIEQVDEDAELALCHELLAANPKIVADIKEGKLKAAGALIGMAKQKNPNVDPGRIRARCIELAQNM